MCQKGQDAANDFADVFASVCNPVWQVKEWLMQNPQPYLLGFFAWNPPQMSHPPFLECVLMKHCSHVLLWNQGSSEVLGDRAAYWGKNAMNFIYCLCGSYRKWNSEPDWNRASGMAEWKKILKGFWKSWAALQGSWGGWESSDSSSCSDSLFYPQKINIAASHCCDSPTEGAFSGI